MWTTQSLIVATLIDEVTFRRTEIFEVLSTRLLLLLHGIVYCL